MLIKIASEWLGADLIFPILLPVHDTFQVLLVFSLTGRDIGALTGQNTESQPISPPKSQWGPSGSQILHFIIVHGLGLMRRVGGRHCLGQHRIPIPVAVKVPLPCIVVFPWATILISRQEKILNITEDTMLVPKRSQSHLKVAEGPWLGPSQGPTVNIFLQKWEC